MNSVISFLSGQTISVFGYQVNIGQSVALALAAAAVTALAIKKIGNPLLSENIPAPGRNEGIYDYDRSEQPSQQHRRQSRSPSPIAFTASVNQQLEKACDEISARISQSSVYLGGVILKPPSPVSDVTLRYLQQEPTSVYLGGVILKPPSPVSDVTLRYLQQEPRKG